MRKIEMLGQNTFEEPTNEQKVRKKTTCMQGKVLVIFLCSASRLPLRINFRISLARARDVQALTSAFSASQIPVCLKEVNIVSVNFVSLILFLNEDYGEIW